MTNKKTVVKNKKIVGQLKEDMLSILSNHLNGNELERLTNELISKDVISGKRELNNCVFTDEDGSEFNPTVTWKPKVKGTKLGKKSKEMVEFINQYRELKNSYSKGGSV